MITRYGTLMLTYKSLLMVSRNDWLRRRLWLIHTLSLFEQMREHVYRLPQDPRQVFENLGIWVEISSGHVVFKLMTGTGYIPASKPFAWLPCSLFVGHQKPVNIMLRGLLSPFREVCMPKKGFWLRYGGCFMEDHGWWGGVSEIDTKQIFQVSTLLQ